MSDRRIRIEKCNLPEGKSAPISISISTPTHSNLLNRLEAESN